MTQLIDQEVLDLIVQWSGTKLQGSEITYGALAVIFGLLVLFIVWGRK